MCRSPMAVGLADSILGPGVTVDSAGIDAAIGAKTAPNAVRVMKEMGINISAHSPKDVSALDLSNYDYVVAMDSAVASLLKHLGLADHRSLIVWNVKDPYGEDLDEYRDRANAIKRSLLSLREALGLKEAESLDAEDTPRVRGRGRQSRAARAN
jgi:protein-tyrosine-phosphatase